MSKGRLFQQILKNRRISQPQTLVLAGAANAEILNAVCQAERDGYITPVLVGVKTDINNIIAENFPEKLDAWEVVHAVGEEEICETSVALIRSRPRAFLSKGLVNTGPLCKALFRHKKEFGIEGLVSHISLLELPWYGKVLGLSDSSINIAPSIDEKEQILKNAVAFFHRLGCLNPLVGVLASIETEHPNMKDTQEAAILRQRNETGLITGCMVDGPISLDLSLDPHAAKLKRYSGHIQGDADILITPDLTSGNLLGKSFNLIPDSLFAGFVLGVNVPVCLTSRASSIQNKYYTLAIGAVLSEGGFDG